MASKGRELRRSGKLKSTAIVGESLSATFQILNDSQTLGSVGHTTYHTSTYLVEDSHARISALPEKEPVLVDIDLDCGLRCTELFAKYDQSSLSWKMLQRCFLEDSEKFLETWPARGSMRNGLCYAPKTSVPPHERARLFAVAYSNKSDGQERLGNFLDGTRQVFATDHRQRVPIWLQAPYPAAGVGNGLSRRMDYRQRVECVGNAIVPQIAEFIGKRIVGEVERQ